MVKLTLKLWHCPRHATRLNEESCERNRRLMNSPSVKRATRGSPVKRVNNTVTGLSEGELRRLREISLAPCLGCPGVRALFMAGEAQPPDHLERWGPRAGQRA